MESKAGPSSAPGPSLQSNLDDNASTPHEPDVTAQKSAARSEHTTREPEQQLSDSRESLDEIERTRSPDPQGIERGGADAAAASQQTQIQFTEEDHAHARRWENKQRPNSKEILTLGKAFIWLSRIERTLWFSDPSLDEHDLLKIEVRLLQKWPRSLGNTVENEDHWILRDDSLQASEFIVTMDQYLYKMGGGMDNRVMSGQISHGMFCTQDEARRIIRNPDVLVPSGKFLSMARWFEDLPDSSDDYWSLRCMAFVMLHAEIGKDLHLYPGIMHSYLSSWQSHRNSLYFYYPTDEMYQQTFNVQFYARVSTNGTGAIIGTANASGRIADDSVVECRESGRIFDSELELLTERRFSWTVKSQFRTRTPCFNVIQLGRSMTDAERYWKYKEEHGGPFAGMHVFINSLATGLTEASREWSKVLDGFDEKLGATVSDLLDERTGHRLMFDDKNFTRSKMYFTTQQLCRLFDKCITQTIRDVDEVLVDFRRHWDPRARVLDAGWEKDLKDLEGHWAEAMVEPKLKLNSILNRVRDKQEEVESLRDGLFNATSVREASRGTELAQISFRQNQYLFVFTIMTVVYLPLGFVTSVFGMHLFDNSDAGVVAARPQFYTTLVVLSISTYVAAGLAFWFVRNKERLGSANDKGKDSGGVKMKAKREDVPEMRDEEKAEEGGIFASMRQRSGKGEGKGKGKETSAV